MRGVGLLALTGCFLVACSSGASAPHDGGGGAGGATGGGGQAGSGAAAGEGGSTGGAGAAGEGGTAGGANAAGAGGSTGGAGAAGAGGTAAGVGGVSGGGSGGLAGASGSGAGTSGSSAGGGGAAGGAAGTAATACPSVSATISTDKASYKDTDKNVVVTFSGLRGGNDDLLTLAYTSSTPGTWLMSYRPRDPITNANLTAGGWLFTEPYVGTYVIRYQVQNQIICAKSAPFTVFTPTPTTVSTSKSSYVSGEAMPVTWMNLPNTGLNWIYIAVPGSPIDQFVDFKAVNTPNGTNNRFFTAPAAGTYVLRGLDQSPSTLLAESAPFAVTPKPATTQMISTDKASYRFGETITITYSGLPGYAMDVIELALASDSDATYRGVAPTNGQTSGTATITAPNSAGDYVVRVHVNGTTVVSARSAVFTVAAQ